MPMILISAKYGIFTCDKCAFGDFYRHEGFLFKKYKLCVPICSIRELLVRESHGGGLMGHLGVLNTLDILRELFYWPNMKHDVQSVCDKCITCRREKSKVRPHGKIPLCLCLLNLGLIYLWILI